MKTKAFTLIILAGLLWGSSCLFVHYLSPYGFTPLQLAGVRATVSFFVMVLYILIRDIKLFKIKLTDFFLTLLIGAALFASAGLYYISMALTSASTSVVLLYTAPIYVTLFSALIFKEKLSPIKLIATAIMLIGCIFVAGLIGGARFDLVGALMGVAAGVAFAAYNILTKITLNRGAKPISVSCYAFLGATICSFFFAAPISTLKIAATAIIPTFPLLIGLAICTFVIPYFMSTLSLNTLDAGTVTSLSIVEPLSATIFGVVFLNEALTPLAVIGTILILGAVVLLGIIESSETLLLKNAKATKK